MPEPTQAATQTPVPTQPAPSPTATEPAATATATVAAAVTAELDPALGRKVWTEKPCIGCHGANAEGNLGPRLAGTRLTFEQVLRRVRTGKTLMPAFAPEQVSDLEVRQIYAWLQSLAP